MNLGRLMRALRQVSPGALSIKPGWCPCCGPTVLIRLNEGELLVRCSRCKASVVSMSLVSVLTDVVPELKKKTVYELSSSGPVFEFLKREAGMLVFSEFLDDVPPGALREGVQCQDVQGLTFPDESFDVCTSTEVFEHVPDDKMGFVEVNRVLRNGGVFVFTVPLRSEPATIERARIEDGRVIHMMEPEYHDDRLRGHKKVLAFRHYGMDILDRLRGHGFSRAQLMQPKLSWFGYRRSVIVAWK